MMLISTSLFPVVNLTPVVAGARFFTANRRLRNASRAKIFFSKQNGRRVMRVSRYRPVVYLQLSLLFLDIFINSFGDLFRAEDVILLVLYIIQDVCILFAVIVVFLVFFNTYIFQAGLVFLLIRKFKTTIIITVLYLLLSLGLHVWTMTRKWGDPETYIWNGGFQVLYVFQRLGSVLYYYYYKKTCLKLGDPRFYQESEWLRREFARVH